MKRVYGWKRDPPDERDLYATPVPFYRGLYDRFPAEFDLESLCTPIEDQSSIGSCVSHGVVAAMEMLDNSCNDGWTDLSRLFGYWVIRDDKDEDAGAYIRDAIKRVAKYGICDEALWPYDVSKYAVTPPVEAFQDAQKRAGIEYRRIHDHDRKNGIMSALYDLRVPVIFGFYIYSSFDDSGVATTGIVRVPGPKDEFMGGHCVDIVGWKWIAEDFRFGEKPSFKQLYFKCRNSWGPAWGQRGYFYLPEQYITDKGLSDDYWIITRVPQPVPKPLKDNEGVYSEDVVWYVPVVGIWQWIKKLFVKGE